MLLMLTHQRRIHGLRRYELARAVGMDPEALRLIESGRVKPTPAQRVNLAAALEWDEEPAALFAVVPSITRAELERRRAGVALADLASYCNLPEREAAAILAGDKPANPRITMQIANMLQYRGNLMEFFEEVLDESEPE